MTLSHENAFSISGPLWGESIDEGRIPVTKVSAGVIVFFCIRLNNCELTVELSAVWDVMEPIWNQVDDLNQLQDIPLMPALVIRAPGPPV